MGRPFKKRFVAFKPGVCYFKPRGIPMLELEEIQLTVDQREALRLADYEGLSVRSNSCLSIGLKSRPGNCPFTPVVQGSGV
jgi:uncharacterized protein